MKKVFWTHKFAVRPIDIGKSESRTNTGQGQPANSTPDISWWHLPVFHGMANKAKVANKAQVANIFCGKILANMIFSCKVQQISLEVTLDSKI